MVLHNTTSNSLERFNKHHLNIKTQVANFHFWNQNETWNDSIIIGIRENVILLNPDDSTWKNKKPQRLGSEPLTI